MRTLEEFQKEVLAPLREERNKKQKAALEIKTKAGAGFSIDTSTNDITIHTSANVNLDCNEVRLTKDAEDKLILGSKLMEIFNDHKHFTSDGQSSGPIQQFTVNDFSKKIKIG